LRRNEGKRQYNHAEDRSKERKRRKGISRWTPQRSIGGYLTRTSWGIHAVVYHYISALEVRTDQVYNRVLETGLDRKGIWA